MPASRQFITRPVQEILGQNPGYGFAGLGVNTAIGNFTLATTDLWFSDGLLGLLDWRRTYNSRGGADGPLGPGWTISFGARLVSNRQGVLHHSGPVTFYDEDGRELTFTPVADGGYAQPQDLNADLTKNPDGSFALSYATGLVWTFDPSGRLTGRSLEGQQVSLDYDAAGRLLRATHSSGPYLSFGYDDSGRLTGVETSDGRTVSLAYSAGPASVPVLQSVTAPGGGVTGFGWAGSGSTSQLARLTDADGNLVVVNAYDDAMGRVTSQQFASGGGAAFRYDDSAGSTVVTATPSGSSFTFQADEQGRMTRVTRPDGSSASFGYDAAGHLTQGTTPGGTQFEQTFDSQGNVVSATYGGATTAWTYDDANRPTSLTDQAGGVTRYAYTGSSRIPSAVTDPLGGITRIASAGGLVTARTDADGNVTTYGYDPAGNLVSVTGPAGHAWSFGFDAAGNRVSFTTPSGAVTQYEYDPAGRLVASTDPAGAVMRYQYSAAGLLLQTTDQAGGVYLTEYDAAGHITRVTDPLGQAASYEYDPDGNPVTFTDRGGSVSHAEYDALGRVTAMTDATGTVVRRYTYDADGNRLTVETPAGTSSSTYDPRGNMTSVTDRLGAITHFAFDAADRLIEVTYPDGSVHSTTYDPAGNAITSTDPLGGVTRRIFSPAGEPTAVIDPLGRQTSYALDGDGNVTTVTDPQGGVTRYAYDADNRRISVITPAGLVTRFRYHPNGRVAAVTDPRGWITRYEYSPRRDLTAVIDAGGAVQRFRYDAAAQLVESVDANGSVTRYGYDNSGRMTALTDPKGDVTRYAYDENGQLVSVTDPLGRSTQNGYNTAGQLVTVTDPSGHVVHMAYDAMNRLTGKTADGAVPVSFSYDSAGRRASMTDATGTTHYAYDQAGRLTSVTDPDGGVTTAGYDAAGQRTSLTYPSGRTRTYTYDLNGRLVALHDPLAGYAAYALDADGRLLTEELPGRHARRYDYEHGLLRRFTVFRDGHPVADTSFRHDPVGRILAQSHGSRLREYRYDRAGQLVLADLDLVYDVAGNRTEARHDESVTRYRYDAADQLLATEAGRRRVEFRYDSCGRLTEQAGDGHRLAISYDGFGQPAAIIRAGRGEQERLEPVFNGDGLLTSLTMTVIRETGQEERAASVRYRWGTFGQIPQIIGQDAAPDLDDAERDRPGRLSAEFSYGYGRTFAGWEGGAATFHRDAFGSPVRTGDTEDWVQAGDYSPFGVPVPGPDGDAQRDRDAQRGHEHGGLRPPELPRFGYRGELAIGPMIYLRARLYDPALGRFLSRDSVTPLTGPAQGRNPYAYAGNDPLQFIDPLGTLLVAPSGGGGQIARGTAIHPGKTPVPGTIAIGQNVLISADDPKARALEAAWAWIIRQFGVPRSEQAQFDDWVRLCHLQPYGFRCQGELNLGFSLNVQNYSLEGVFQEGAKIFLSSIAQGTVGGFIFPLYAVQPGGLTKKQQREELRKHYGGPVRPYQTGTYGILVDLSDTGDCLEIHHVPQNASAGRTIGGTSRNRGPSIALPNLEHGRIPNRRGTYVGTGQQLVLEDLRKLTVYTRAPLAQLRELINVINAVYPGILPVSVVVGPGGISLGAIEAGPSGQGEPGDVPGPGMAGGGGAGGE